METIVGILVGTALAAACGFRVFVPLLVLGIAGRGGHVPLAGDFHWITTMPALIALGTATVLEIVAYYVPWLDHVLDTIATPSAVLAGVIATAAVVGDLPPIVRWGLAIVAGGSAAGTVQGATVLARLKSGTMTAGLANPVVATVELAGSVVTSVLAVVVPLLALALIVALLVWAYRTTRRVFFRRSQPVPDARENEVLDDSQRGR
ncbi:MAG TPA: DUF4126 domain-containing protein [Candidatus Krumholzibacteria bacterium]